MTEKFYIATTNIDQNGILDKDCAFCDMTIDGYGKGENLSPHLFWGNIPEGTKSFALLCVDIDVPTDFTNANKPDIFIDAAQKRTNFIHWMICNIPANYTELPKGFMNKNQAMYGYNIYNFVQGLTDYKKRYGDKAIGYWGPCGPVNDTRIHRYIFRLYALNVETLALENGFSYEQFTAAIEKSTIATANLIALYSRNPLLIK
jgi:Raf kinase inhibitor-like YbhB/YbcL family protein